MTSKGAVGILNMGNTCFAASVFQALRSIPELSAYILKNDMDIECKDTASKEGQITVAYKDLIKTLFSGSIGDVCRPAGFYDTLKDVVKDTIYEQFSQRIPNDAHEFTVYILDQLHEGMKRQFNLKNKKVSDLSPSQKAWHMQFNKSYSPLTDLLFGLERIDCICRNCNNKSTKWEVFNMIKVGFNNITQFNINNMLINEMKHIDTLEDYQCDSCNKRTTVDIYRGIWKLPHILIVVIRRFNEIGNKEHTSVDISTKLHPTEIFSKDSPEPSKKYSYDLISIVNHHGSHFGGHYTSAALNPVDSQWYFYDDESVVPFNTQRLSEFGSNVYISVYRKSS
jgi:ubiquitin C-terminal hydrolase